MAESDEQPLVQESTAKIVSSGAGTSVRLAHFLLPRADAAHPPALPPPPPSNPGPVLDDALEVEFKGCWASESPRLWRRWVAKLQPRHERLWRSVGIFGAVLATTSRVRRDEGALLQLAAFWSGDTNTFVFPWGEATVTLEDVAVLGGLPLLGKPVREPPHAALRGDVDALETVRRALYQSKNSRPDRTAWAKHFLERPADKTEVAAGGREAYWRLEHGAFLAMWLSLFVLPAAPFDVIRAEVFPIAAQLARGRGVALAPAALASIYNDLTALKRYINLEKRYQPFVVWAPLHIVQLWLWKRFPELCPETVCIPEPDGHGIPREAQWHDALKVLDPVYVHAVFMSPKKFEWRPYGSNSFVLRPEMGGRRIHGQDIAASPKLLSFILCLRACELVGMRCIEHYQPHRVARQLSFDQDVPGTLARVNSNWVAAWGTYKMEPKKFVFIVPMHKPAATIDYVQWWEPYLLGCANVVAKSKKMQVLPISVCPRKRKIDLPPDTSARQVRDGAEEKAVEVLFEVPVGLGSTVNGLPQASATETEQSKSFKQGKEDVPDLVVANDKEIRSSLHSGVELNYLVKDAANTGSSDTVGAANVVDVRSEELLFDMPVALVRTPDELSSVSATRKEQCKPSHQDKEESISVVHDNESRRSVTDLHSTPVVTANAGSNEDFGPATVVDVQSAPEYIEVISDVNTEDKLNAMHQKLPQLKIAPSSLEEQNLERQIVSESSNALGSPVMKDVMACDHQTDTVQSNTIPGKEPFEVLDVATVQPSSNLLERPTEQNQTCTVTGHIYKGDMLVEKENLAGLEGIKKANEDISSSFQKIDSPVQDCIEAYSKTSSGNNCSSGLAHVDTQLVSRTICTNTLYYISPFKWPKHGQDRDASGTTADDETFQPRREIGTQQMIDEAFAARQAEKVELEKVIARLKEEIVALDMQRTGGPR